MVAIEFFSAARTLALAVLFASLSACGGGGSDNGGASDVPPSSQSPTPAPAPAPTPTPAPTLSISADAASVVSGGTSNLTWTSSNADSCSASGAWSGMQATSGSYMTDPLTADATFTLMCSGAGGDATQSVTVTVTAMPAPTVTISAMPTSVTSGGTATLSWNATNATACMASDGWSGAKAIKDSEATSALTVSTKFTLTCTGPGGSASSSVTVNVNTVGSIFPLHTENGKRYLIDAQNRPFLLQGDAAWSMIAQLTDAEVDQYLDDRKSRGFNTVLVNLIEHKFATNAPKDVLGQAPFTSAGDFSKPNDAYFDRAVTLVQKASDRNMLVLLAPAYLGYGGGDEGWYQEMKKSGTTVLRNYGRYVAGKFSALKNILWVEGGDYTPPDLALPDAVAQGIRDVLPNSLHTYHGSPEISARQSAGGYSWLGLNDAYTYDTDLSQAVKDEYDASQLPLILIESRYENEGSTTPFLRSHEYQALLAGAAGQMFGNNPIWCFSGVCSTNDWQDALDSYGSMSMTKVWDLFSNLSWWLLQPDDSLVNTGHAALASDKSFAVAYVTHSVTVQMSQLAAGTINARWYNPFTGEYTSAGTASASGTHSFSPPAGSNGDGSDWVLLLEH